MTVVISDGHGFLYLYKKLGDDWSVKSVADDFNPSTYDWDKGERNGRNIKQDDFLSTFGFRATIGDNPDVSQDMANTVYDAFVLIAKTLRVPYEALSLGGIIRHIDIATHGIKGVGGHFDGGNQEIFVSNLAESKRTLQAKLAFTFSTVAHEWTHALDAALSVGRFSSSAGALLGQFMSASSRKTAEDVRPEIIEAFDKMFGALKNSDYWKRVYKYREKYSEENFYYRTPTEMLARAMQMYIMRLHAPKEIRAEFDSMFVDFPESPWPSLNDTLELAPVFDEFFSALRVGTNQATGLPTLFSFAKGDPVASARPGGSVRETMDRSRQWLETKFIHDQTPVFDAVRRVSGNDPLPDRLNVEAAAKNVHGKIRARQEEVNKVYVDTIVNILREPGMSKEVFDDYAMALHAIDRNRMIQARSVVVDPETGEVLDPGLEAGSGMSQTPKFPTLQASKLPNFQVAKFP